jgi:YqxM protein
MIITQIIVIWYSLNFIAIQFISATNAAFIDSTQHTVPLSANYSWDKSSLSFSEKDFDQHYGFNCTDGFYADVKNGGDPMQGATPYFVHYISNNDPNKNEPGLTVYDEGVIPKLGKNEMKRLTYLPEEKPLPGHYKFSAYQRPLHRGLQSDSGRFEIWGVTAVVVTAEQINTCYDNNPNTNVHVKAEPENNEPIQTNQIQSAHSTQSIKTETRTSEIQESNKTTNVTESTNEPEKDTKPESSPASVTETTNQTDEALKEEEPEVEQNLETTTETQNNKNR